MVVERDVWREAGIFADMSRAIVGKSAVVAALLLTGLLFVRFARLAPDATGTNERRFAEKVNLALRRTAHHLLAESGDTISRIAPAHRLEAGTFLLRLERPFNYDRLPVLLQESLHLHDIRDAYDVAVLDCLDGDLQLGYNVQDVQSGNGIPCGGREQGGGCYDLQVTFSTTEPSAGQSVGWWLVASGFLLGGIAYAAWQWADRKKAIPTLAAPQAMASAGLHFGASNLDVANQTLLVSAIRHQLTYRETKLLHLFVSRLGQLLERDFILQSVWQDEGIIVGRSVDVFVSRLRKMLRDDPTVRIVTVHGMGYRMEVV